MSTNDEQTIDRAVRAMGRALAAGADHKAAMRAALAAASTTGCLREYAVAVHGVELMCGFDADIEDAWVITVQPGTDLSELLLNSEFAGLIDVAVVKQMTGETGRDELERIEERHAERRELTGAL